MAYDPAIRTEAYALYLAGNSPAEIARELARRHAEDGARTPSAKTLEQWAYVPGEGGKTWSDLRAEAEAQAMREATGEFVTAQTKLRAGLMRIQAKLAARMEAAVEDAAAVEDGNLTQELYALVNVTKTVDKMLENRVAEEARRKDAIDSLIEAIRRVVPNFDELQPRMMAEFRRLESQKAPTQPAQ